MTLVSSGNELEFKVLTRMTTVEKSPQMPLRMFFPTRHVRISPAHPERKVFRSCAPSAL